LVRVARHAGKRRLEIVIQAAAGKELLGLNVIADPQELGTDIALGALHIRIRLVAPDADIVRERRHMAPELRPHLFLVWSERWQWPGESRPRHPDREQPDDEEQQRQETDDCDHPDPPPTGAGNDGHGHRGNIPS